MTSKRALNDIYDIEQYLMKLNKLKNEYLILLTVKDTPGNAMNMNIQENIHSLGFSNFSTELWTMYIGVIYQGKVIINRKGDRPEDKIESELYIENNKINITSAPWRNGNFASIRINDIDYACNRRGVNILVYDIEQDTPIDSISFDTHVIPYNFSRNAFILEKKNWLENASEKDVCIAGVWYGVNYGSLLNGYATYQIMKKLGKSVLLLQKPNCISEDAELLEWTHNYKFINSVYSKDEMTPRMSKYDIDLVNNYAKIFVSGSDQIWNYNVSFSGLMYLPFVSKEKKKISYCSSTGSANDNVPVDKQNFVGECLKQYDAVSIRENVGKQVLKQKYDIESNVIQEPVFNIEKEYYYNLAKKATISYENKFILAYILDPNDYILEMIKQIALKLDCDIITVPDGAYSIIGSSWDKYRNSKSFPNLKINMLVEDFLNAYINAEFIITDSFHGTCFATIFEKKFITICNRRRGADRFDEILGIFGLNNRLVNDVETFEWKQNYFNEIDYKTINEIIELRRREAINWLEKSLDNNDRELVQVKNIKIYKKQLHDDITQNQEFVKIKILGSLLYDYGIKHIVLSPGGRDVPIVRMFENNEESFIIHRVTDERSAAYFGMGIATQLKQPVACVCTSGTAVSNYLPAVTEAYFTGIPIILITADRCMIYHGQGEDQTIPQNDIFAKVTKKEVTVPEGSGYRVEYQTRRDISDCILECMHNGCGPVHINMAIDNIALGSTHPKEIWRIEPKRNRHVLRVGLNDGEQKLYLWLNELKKSKRILIVYGQNNPLNAKQKEDIERFTKAFNCVVVSDHLGNMNCQYNLKPYRMLIDINQAEFNDKLSPDILITVGGKRLMNDPLTFKIRGGRGDIRHWSVTPSGEMKDFYFRLTSILEMSQDTFFEWFSKHSDGCVNDEKYYNTWKTYEENCHRSNPVLFNSGYIQSRFLPNVPKESILHLGIGQTFIESRNYYIDESVEVYCNMGTNGIDGCTSTFMGQCAVEKDKLCFLLVGDLSFFYDMNSIWNKPLNGNIRILMVNNNGSGLLKNNNLKSITSVHNTSAKGWVQSTGFKYLEAHNKDDFEKELSVFISEDIAEPMFLEVFCD
ncbi:MAG: 2-succinyl-5-enolpyruvyl-6-hydroxy-3-cyclohexene-1-carboxylic-acid synthase [Lachnospiraceae bacterium]|nr:2-succinyl-5-enolpyruvyl-6-hydroxy-3-cyclohexene-1-carboxylic-acid synthase [Lachnospiraceae bacterium]